MRNIHCLDEKFAMQETAEFRIPERLAKDYLSPKDGVTLGGAVRKLKVSTESNCFATIGNIERDFRRNGRAFFASWVIRRKYSNAELSNAQCFLLRIRSVFGPAGEEYGTNYDEMSACPSCHSGAIQSTPLYIPERRIPKKIDIGSTIAGELVASRRIKELFDEWKITGVEFAPIHDPSNGGRVSQEWFQLIVTVAGADIAPPTRVGVDPFDVDDGANYRCPRGDLIGLNLISEVFAKAESMYDSDFIRTLQFVGVRRGLLRPERLILVSPRVRQIMECNGVHGVSLEVCHLV